MPRNKYITPEDVRSRARAYTHSMLRVLVGIAQERQAPPAARVTAAGMVLDRAWGKPQQDVQSKHEVTVIIRKLMNEPALVIQHDANELPNTDSPQSSNDKPKGQGKDDATSG